MDFKLLKDWRIMLVLISIIFAIVAINPTLQGGVVITSINYDSPMIGKLAIGDTIEWANEKTIKTVDDLYQFESFTGVFSYMHNGKLELVQVNTPGLGIEYGEKSKTSLNFGMDMVGGTRILLEPEGEEITSDTVDQILSTLETRINTYGLKETKFQAVEDISGHVYIQIEMAGGSKQDIDELLAKQGLFEGKIPIVFEFENGVGEFKMGATIYEVINENTSLAIGGNNYKTGDEFQIDGIDFSLENYTNEGAFLMTTVFTGNDITSVCMQDNPGICTSRLMQQGDYWQFMFQIFITQNSAQKFADVTNGLEAYVDPNSGESYLSSRIFLYLDDVEITNLGIASDLKGKAYTQPMITGGREVKEDAIDEKLKLQSILQSGALPVKLKTVKVDQISPSLGAEFMNAAGITGLIALLAVASVIFIRYRQIKILIPMILFSILELVLVMGAAAAIGWTIDLASIAGIIAAIGTGTNDQVMMIDEMIMGGGHEKIYTIKQKLKKAFSIIFGAAATIIAAMLPLMFIGIGVMKGFAITTTLGILIGVFITRPAFGKIIEKVLDK